MSSDLESRLRRHVDVLAGLIGPRHLRKKGSLDATCTYIERQFAEIGERVEREPYKIGNDEVANLIVERKGTHKPDEIVILGAHYDTIPSTPGADDNASAVAMLLEVARLTKSYSFPRTLRFVSFPCEEPPHFYTDTMGSQQYARSCRSKNENIVGMICLEMVGYYSTVPGSQKAPDSIPRLFRRVLPDRGDFLAAVGNLQSTRLLWSFRRGYKRVQGVRLFSIALPEQVHEIRLSDNSSFWDQGFPALMVTDTSFLRNPHYHLESDTPDTLDYPRLAQATVGVANAVANVAGSKERIVDLD